MHKLFVLVGSLRKDSFNKKLALAMEKQATGLFTFDYGLLETIPLYNEELEANLPKGVVTMKAQVKKADAVLLVSPEYNRSVPGVLKNAIDWLSRPYTQNSWIGKPCGLAGISPGPTGTAPCQSHLRSIMPMIGTILMAQPELYFSYQDPQFFAADGNFGQESTKSFVRGYLENFSVWVQTAQ